MTKMLSRHSHSRMTANPEVEPDKRLRGTEVGFENIIQGFPRRPFLDGFRFADPHGPALRSQGRSSVRISPAVALRSINDKGTPFVR
jgi:hypothetical protein